MDVYEAIMTRHSTRRYLEKKIEESVLLTIIEAGRTAPSGCNNRMTELFVLTDPKEIGKAEKLVSNVLAGREPEEMSYTSSSMNAAIRQAKEGRYQFAYGAPVLVVTANKKRYGNALPDSACVIENMMLMAHALQVGSCWVNQLRWLQEEPAVAAWLYTLGLPEDEFVTGSVAFGYPAVVKEPVRKVLRPFENPVHMLKTRG